MSLRATSSSKSVRRLSQMFGFHKPPVPASPPAVTESCAAEIITRTPTPTATPSSLALGLSSPSSPIRSSFGDDSLSTVTFTTLELDLGPDFLASAVIEHIEQEREKKAQREQAEKEEKNRRLEREREMAADMKRRKEMEMKVEMEMRMEMERQKEASERDYGRRQSLWRGDRGAYPRGGNGGQRRRRW